MKQLFAQFLEQQLNCFGGDARSNQPARSIAAITCVCFAVTMQSSSKLLQNQRAIEQHPDFEFKIAFIGAIAAKNNIIFVDLLTKLNSRYTALWQVAQVMSYQEFYKKWHNDRFSETTEIDPITHP